MVCTYKFNNETTDYVDDHKHLKSGFIDSSGILTYITNVFLQSVLTYPVEQNLCTSHSTRCREYSGTQNRHMALMQMKFTI